MSIIKKLYKDGHLNIEQSFAVDTHLEVLMGSTAYGSSTKSSDKDVHAITTPPLNMVFPHLTGHLVGFDDAPQSFDNFQQHHINVYDNSYDVVIHSIIKFFRLAMENNPNALDMLWVPDNCVLSIDDIGIYIRKNRARFLHKGSYYRFLGYAHSQFKKMENTKRSELVEEFGYDVKAFYHIARLTLQCEQVLEDHDMDFSENSDFLIEIRNGLFTLDQAKGWYRNMEETLGRLYLESTLQYAPDKKYIKNMLLECLEIKFGSLDLVYSSDGQSRDKLAQIREIVNS